MSLPNPIIPGNYKMRNGCKAIIAAVAPSELDVTQPVVGWWAVSSIEERWTLGMWCLDGKFHIGPTQSAADLISPWIDAPIFNHWDKVPWAKCVYRHQGVWFATSNKMSWNGGWLPEPITFDSYPVHRQLIITHWPTTFTGHDKDSLILRPENV